MNPASKPLKSVNLQQLMPAAMAWALSVNASGLARGKPLSLCQAADATEVGVKKPDAVRILRIPSLPEPDCADLRRTAGQCGLDLGRSHGMALGYAVLICHSALGDRRVLRHELRHVAQFETAGSLSQFLEEYLAQIVRHGYRDAPLEIDARRHEGRLRRAVQAPLRAP
jgi:hypothetical protein